MNIALFGGTFDPIHTAHLTIAREAAAELSLDRVLFIPAAHPPHKRDVHADFEHRYRMVELACAGEPLFVPSRLDERRGKSFSILTIERARDAYPGDVIDFIIGADAFAEITAWYRWEDVVRAVQFIVVTRPGHTYATPPGATVHRLETLALEVSSSSIRESLAAGGEVPELPAAVLAYIREHRLYGAH